MSEIDPQPVYENTVSGQVADAALKVHRGLGPGLLESVYETVLAHELRKRGLKVIRQHPIAVSYEGVQFEEGFRADLLVSDCVLVELKSVERVLPVHKKQLLTYLRLSDFRLGLLINIKEVLLKHGITRVANKLPG